MRALLRHWFYSNYWAFRWRLACLGPVYAAFVLDNLHGYDLTDAERVDLECRARRKVEGYRPPAVDRRRGPRGVWRTVIEVTVLSKGPYRFIDLDDLHAELAYRGEIAASAELSLAEELSPSEALAACRRLELAADHFDDSDDDDDDDD